MHQLQVLKIITPRIRTVPQSIRYLHNVYHLELRDCDLEEFPAAVCDMRNLTFLDLSDNRNVYRGNTKGNMWEAEETATFADGWMWADLFAR